MRKDEEETIQAKDVAMATVVVVDVVVVIVELLLTMKMGIR